MAKKTPSKRAFDWRTHSRPARLLTPAQEDAFSRGPLEPVLAWVRQDSRSRFEIRSRAVGLYHRGVSIGRITGEEPFVAELDAGEGAVVTRSVLTDDAVVDEVVARLSAERDRIDTAIDSGEEPRTHRSFAAAIAAGNEGGELNGDAWIAADGEYAIGRRKLDLAVLLRSDGVAGPGGFATPDLAFVDVRVAGQGLAGPGGLAALADDVADFAKALSGEHVRRAHEEIVALVGQKVRLGLLPPDLEVRSLAAGVPHLIIAFAERDPDGPGDNEAIVALHDRLVSRHYPTHRLNFVHFTATPEDGEGLAVSEGDLMDYRAFKAYRRAGG